MGNWDRADGTIERAEPGKNLGVAVAAEGAAAEDPAPDFPERMMHRVAELAL